MDSDPTVAPSPEIVLPERFELDCEIGRGGMAVVYRAHDRHLGRYVAIKVLSADRSNTLGAERFAREIGLMAKLVHPGIVALFDSGEFGGRLFYVMPLVTGKNSSRAPYARPARSDR
jgi:serine/threonine-protein kinase